MFKRMSYYFISLILLMIILTTNARAQPQSGTLNINGIQTGLIYFEQNDKRYYSLNNIASELKLKVDSDNKNNKVVITYPDECETKILLAEKQLIKEHLKSSIDIIVKQDDIFIAEKYLEEITRKKYFWDGDTKVLSLYL